MSHFTYEAGIYGVTLTSPDEEVETIFLHGDDAEYFLDEIEKLEAAWRNGNPNPSCFNCQEDHLDILIEPYF